MFSTRTCDSIGRRRSRRVCRQQTVWVFVVYGIVALLHLSLAKSNGLARFACKKIRPMNIKDWCRCSVSSVGRSVSWWHRKTLKLNWNGLTCVCWEMLSALHSSLLVMIMFSSRNQMHMLKNVESEFLVSIFLRFFLEIIQRIDLTRLSHMTLWWYEYYALYKYSLVRYVHQIHIRRLYSVCALCLRFRSIFLSK